jgi:hypothetical protein
MYILLLDDPYHQSRHHHPPPLLRLSDLLHQMITVSGSIILHTAKPQPLKRFIRMRAEFFA